MENLIDISLQRFKNNIQRCISVTFRATGKAANMTSKAHYERGGW